MHKNLIHIGYAKAGSSFLQNWFLQHPNFVYVENGMLGFIDIKNMFHHIYTNELISSQTKEVNKKNTFFVTSHEDISFWKGPLDPVGLKLQAYPIKEHQKRVAKYFNELFQSPQILIITRGFESIILSAYSQYVKVGGILSFADFTTQYEKLMLDFWDYDYIVNLYRDLFGKENVIVLPYELLQKNSNSFLENIEQQLEIERFSFPTDKINPSLNAKEFYWNHYLSNKLYAFIQPFSKKRQHQIYQAYIQKLIQQKFHFFSKIGQKLFPKKAMSLETDKKILQKFRNKATFAKKEAVYQEFLAVYLQDQP